MAGNSKLLAYISLTFLLWLFTFNLEWWSFWARIGLSVALLLGVALHERRDLIQAPWRCRPRLWLWGALAGAAFYLLLYAGFHLFRPLLWEGAMEVYALRGQLPLTLIALVLLFTSTGEEVYWRGFLQEEFRARLGSLRALLTTAGLYAAVHLSTLNPPLILAALLAGLVWGALYSATRSLQAPVASHLVWTEMVFVFLPLPG